MASTYSNLKIQLMATGENNSTWGTVTNVNLGTAIEEAITGSVDVTFASGDVTLTLTNTNATQSARNLRLNCTGTTGGARNLILGSGCQIEKVYIVNNGCADAITVKNTTGNGIAVPAGKTMYVFNNGTDVVDAITHLTSLTLASALPVASGGTGSTTAAFSGANISNLNGSNVTSGTIDNARTTASSSNGANTIVARGASGEFAAGAITGVSFSGDGSGLTALNASNISTGTIANARTTASSSNGASTIVTRDASGNFSANVITADGSGLTALNASNISTGTISNARTTASSSNGASTIVTRDASGNFSANTITASLTGTASGNLTSGSALNASNISSGTLAIARMAAGTIIKVSSIVFTTRTVTSSQVTYDLNLGTFTKTYDSSTSDIFIVGTIPCWSFDNSAGYLNIKVGSTAKYTGIATSQISSGAFVINVSQYWSGLGSGSQTVYTGWAAANGSSNRPVNTYIPNSTDEARNQQSGAELIIYEVLKQEN